MTAGFEPGDRVRVLSRDSAGHVRTPAYLRGRTGRVESVLGEFRNPEDLAYGGTGLPRKSLYKVGFPQRELWDGYGGPAKDMLYADIYEHWLERESQESA